MSRQELYLHCLNSGARVVDPGDLDPATEDVLEQMTAAGILICKRNHGRRKWSWNKDYVLCGVGPFREWKVRDRSDHEHFQPREKP